MKLTMMTRRISAALLAAVLCAAAAGCGVKVNPGTSDPQPDTPSSTTSDGSLPDSSADTSDEPTSGTDAASGTENSSRTSSSQGGTKATSGSSQSSGQSSGTKKFTEPVYDLGGRVIRVVSEDAAPDLSDGSIFSESVKLTQKKYNCTFKFIQKTDYFGTYETLITDHASQKASYDVVQLRGYDVYPNAAVSGAILEVDSVYDFKNDPTWQDANFKAMATFKGKWYAIPYSPNETGVGIWYNRALLRAANVPDLWTYVNEDKSKNKWTFDTFRAVCRKLTRDTNGDGKPDVWAFTAEDPWLSFVSANGASLLTTNANGEPKITLDSAASLEALQFVSDLFTDNTVPDGAELGAITNSPFNAMLTGKVAMFPYHVRYGAVLEKYGIPSADIGWIYFPMGPSAKGFTTSCTTVSPMYVIPRHVSEPKQLVAAVQDMCAYWDTSRAVRRDIYDKTEELYKALSGSLDANAKKLLTYQAKNPVYTYQNNFGLGEILQNELWPSILNQTKSVKSAVSSYKSALQEKATTAYRGTVTKG